MRRTIKILLLFALFACHVNSVFSQINGIVRDDQGEPLEGVHVWLSGTQSGDFTNSEGTFHLSLDHGGPIEIVVSHIGYKFYKKTLTPRDTSRTVSVRLRPSTTQLEEVLITAQSSKKRKKWLSQFERAFFGNTVNAKYCEILNPDVLLFEKIPEGMKIVASDVVQLRNSALGYNVLFHLDHAIIKGEGISYSGKFLFEPISITDPKEIQRIERARRKSYLGSLSHFFRTLISNTVREEQFTISEVAIETGQSGEELALRRNQIIREGSSKGEYVLMFKNFLKVSYYGEDVSEIEGVDKIGYVARNLGRPAEQDMISQEKNELNKSRHGQVSFLFLKKIPVIVLQGGYLKDPKYLEEQGYLAKERFAEMLPLEFGATFELKSSKKKKSDRRADKEAKERVDEKFTDISNATIVNGFALTNLKIHEDDIKSGGPPRDGIPAIDYPVFALASDVAGMSEDEMVLGILINDVARAYPTRILDKHEIVNDVIDGQPVTVSYCPLCNSGIAFDRTVNGVTRSFGVSGLLYNSDVLMYDRETESLWSQIMGSAISGPDAGAPLEALPIVMSTWSWWKEQYPDSEVLTGQEGRKKEYSKSAYARYRSSGDLMFPVSEQSGELKNKDMVIGINVDGQSKAYSYKALARAKNPLQDTLNGQALLVYIGEDKQTAWITDENGNLLTAEPMYWFAWYAFHTNTELFR